MSYSLHCQKLAVVFAMLQLSALQSDAQNNYGFASVKSKSTRQTNILSGYNSSSQEKQSLFSVLKELNRVKGVYFLFSEQSMGNILVRVQKDLQGDTEKILAEI